MTTLLAGTAFIVTALLNWNNPIDSGRMYCSLEPVLLMQSEGHGDISGFLGVRLGEMESERAKSLKLPDDRGVEIKAVKEGSPADRAGILPGDVLLTYNGETLLGVQQLSRLVQETPPGRHVKVQLWRDGKAKMLTVVVGEALPLGEMRFQNLPFPKAQPPNLDFPTPLLVWRNAAIGIDFELVDTQLASYFGVRSGVLIRAVQHASPADRAGIRVGDVIFSVSGQSLASEHDLASMLRAGAKVPISLMRDHRRVDLTITVP
jgi:serine protease Do